MARQERKSPIMESVCARKRGEDFSYRKSFFLNVINCCYGLCCGKNPYCCSDFVNFTDLMLEIKWNTFTVVFTSDWRLKFCHQFQKWLLQAKHLLLGYHSTLTDFNSCNVLFSCSVPKVIKHKMEELEDSRTLTDKQKNSDISLVEIKLHEKSSPHAVDISFTKQTFFTSTSKSTSRECQSNGLSVP